jgi:RNAse (barnase) inhibitor barstar
MKINSQWQRGMMGPFFVSVTQNIEPEPEQEGLLFACFHGERMKDLPGFYTEIAAVLQFPSYFGRNFDALYDCLTDLGWLSFKSILFVFTNSEQILSECSAGEREVFGEVLKDTCDFWVNPHNADKDWGHSSVPFHVILRFQDEKPLPQFSGIYHFDTADNNKIFEAGMDAGI